jgi:hypothetical protein
MAHSAYASIGHLIYQKQNDIEKTSKLREFCKKILQNLTENLVQGESCVYQFDLFFESIKPTVESFGKVI